MLGRRMKLSYDYNLVDPSGKVVLTMGLDPSIEVIVQMQFIYGILIRSGTPLKIVRTNVLGESSEVDPLQLANERGGG